MIERKQRVKSDSTSKRHWTIHAENLSIFRRLWKSTSKVPRQTDVIFSKCIHLSKLMTSQSTFQVKFLPWIDGKLTKMCTLDVSFLECLKLSLYLAFRFIAQYFVIFCIMYIYIFINTILFSEAALHRSSY